MLKFLSILIFSISSQAHAKLLDRVLLTLNQIPYTQRNFELYVALKESLREQPEPNFFLVTRNEYKDALDFFTDEHLLLQDLERTSSFKPSQELSTKAKEKVENQKQSNPKFETFLKNFDVSEKEQTQLIRQILFVQNYKSSLQIGKDKKDDLLKKKIDELKNNAIVRVLIDAGTFQPLNIQ